jgi:16S rRNA C1402 N4-methylase RsmH
LHAEDILLATDWDIENLRRAQERLRQEKFSAKYELIHSSYTEISALMAERNIPHLTGCMLDL